MEEKKLCTSCNNEWPLDHFGVKNKKTGLRQWACKKCARDLSKFYYQKNVDYYKTKSGIRRKVTQKQQQEYIRQYLLIHPCVDCGESDIVCLDFDHVRGEKANDIAHLIRSGGSWNKIIEEMGKCDVRCANCHRKRTARQFGSWRLGSMLEIDEVR